MSFERNAEVDRIRKRIDHPVIDGDGHLIEYTPVVRDFLVEEAGEEVAKRFDGIVHGSESARKIPLDQKRAVGYSRTAWWGLAGDTLDRASAILPRLLHGRLDEMGIDFAFLYPTYGLFATTWPDDELRIGLSRAFNRYYAAMFEGVRDRLEPVAVIPTVTPEEGVAALDHAILELGLKAVTLSGVVGRAFPGSEDVRGARYFDTLGHDSDYDYDPLWRRCVELGVTPTFHGSSQGMGMRASRTNYVYNHIGNFAVAGEAACRSLFMGGVPMRFPDLHFAFLEGGVAWGANLYSDILAHYEKRNINVIEQYDPARLDREEMARLFRKYAPEKMVDHLDELDEGLLLLADPAENRDGIDEFAESGVKSEDDIRHLFSDRFYFGCEADDPLTAVAFDTAMLPGGARLRPVFASDIGHWDVPDMCKVLPEAWELVEDGHIDEEAFEAFVCGNALALWTSNDPDFFEGTAIEDAASNP
ncbi:amidohydrolase [Myxococcota bacterium]|nr:amidohydrolase [Myxococcota bacterium]